MHKSKVIITTIIYPSTETNPIFPGTIKRQELTSIYLGICFRLVTWVGWGRCWVSIFLWLCRIISRQLFLHQQAKSFAPWRFVSHDDRHTIIPASCAAHGYHPRASCLDPYVRRSWNLHHLVFSSSHYLGRFEHPITRPNQCLSLMVSKCFQLYDHSSPLYSSIYLHSHTLKLVIHLLVHLCIFQCSNSHLLASTTHQSNDLICPIIPTKSPSSPHGNSQSLPFLSFCRSFLALISLVS